MKQGFNIGRVAFHDVVVMAPMAGLTNYPLRRLAAQLGCRAFWTEMVPSEALVRRRPEAMAMLPDKDDPHPLAVQIFGADPAVMAEAAAMACGAGADVVDINMACPVRRINKTGAGAAVMRDPAAAARLVEAVAGRCSVPVSVKIRSGWDGGSLNAMEVATAVAGAGAAAVVIHGRTRVQAFAGKADHGPAAEMAAGLSVPVLVSGDIASGPDAAGVLRATGAAAVMIGRAAIGRPWIYGQISDYLRKGEEASSPDDATRLLVMQRHLDLLAGKFGERNGLKLFRPHLVGYLRGRANGARLRQLMLYERSLAGLKDSLARAIRDSG